MQLQVCETLVLLIISNIPFYVTCLCGRDEYYAWGLNQIAKAVSFLNNDCKLVSGHWTLLLFHTFSL